MKESRSHKPALKKLPAVGRRHDALDAELVKLDPLQGLPLVVEPTISGVDLAGWIAIARDVVEAQLLKHGGMLFRNFATHTVAEFERVIKAVVPELLEYRERSSPRSQVGGNIYTSTDYPADQSIFLHNENSYQHSWPLKIFFFCVVPAQQGGETPIADVRRVLAQIEPAIRERFERKQVMYVRNFSEGLGLPWQTVFQTDDRAEVEAYCRNAGIIVEWLHDQGLRTRQVRPAIVAHPRTNEPLWFNHATFFHVSTLAAPIRDALLSQMHEEDLPCNSYYGDGTPIEPAVLDALRAAYAQATVAFPWRQGDLLMLDNMLVAHARAPFVGPRKVVVGMAEPIHSEEPLKR